MSRVIHGKDAFFYMLRRHMTSVLNMLLHLSFLQLGHTTKHLLLCFTKEMN